MRSGLALNTTKYSLEDVSRKWDQSEQAYTFGNIWSPRLDVVSAKSGKTLS
jgi:hypothetical protein